MTRHQTTPPFGSPLSPLSRPGILRFLPWAAGAALLAIAVVFSGTAQAQGSMYGDLAVRPGFQPDPIVMRGQSGGPINASQYGAGCLGWISPNPSHMVRVDQPIQFMRLFIQSATDTTLVVQTPTGQMMCNDDTYGLNPAVAQYWQPGIYRIWVGSYAQGQQGPYQISFTENPNLQPGQMQQPPPVQQGGAFNGGGGPQAQPAPNNGLPANPMTLGVRPPQQNGPSAQPAPPQGGGALDVNAQQGNSSPGWIETRLRPDPQVLEGRAGGPLSAAQAADSRCRGYVQSAPDHIIYVQGRSRYLRLTTQASGDLTMIIRTPDGRFLCDDDGGEGMNPSIAQDEWPPGQYMVWIGTYSRSAPGSTPYRLMITREQPAAAGGAQPQQRRRRRGGRGRVQL